MPVCVREKPAAGHERLQDGLNELFVCPLAFGKEGGHFVLFAHDVDLCLGFVGGIAAPPAAKGGELHRRLAAEQLFPKVLLANLLEHLAHVCGQLRLDAPVDELRRAAGDQGGVFRDEAVPEAEHVVIDGIDRLF